MAITNALYFPAIASRIAQEVTANLPSTGSQSQIVVQGPVDSYSTGSAQSDIGVLTPRQALAMKAQSQAPSFGDKELMAAVSRHDYSKLSQMSGTPAQKRELLAKFHQSHPTEYAALIKDVRAGKVKDANFQTLVALETLGGTKWAKTPDGAKTMAHLTKLHNEGRIVTEQDPGGLGHSSNIGSGSGRDGSKVDTKITLQTALLDSPEGAAAILAHEGQHSYRASQGTMKRVLAEEVDAHTTQNAVWTEFGKEKNNTTAADAVRSLNTSAEYDTEQKLYNHIAATYAAAGAASKDKGNRAAARGVIVDYMEYSRQHNHNPSSNIHDEDLKSLVNSGKTLLGAKSSDNYRAAVEHLKQEQKNRAEADAD